MRTTDNILTIYKCLSVIIMKTLTRLTLVLSLISAACFSYAQEVEKKLSPLRLIIGFAGEFGGDPVAEVSFTDGKTQKVLAGQGLSLIAGGQYQFPKAEKLLLRGTVGYKYVTTMASNANIRLTRVPIQLTANWMAAKKLRLSAGLANHQIIQFKSDGIGEDGKFKSSSGAIFEVAYSVVGLTYTAMKYKDPENFSYSANSFVVSFTTTIPRRLKAK
jgi:hypothetical protein